MKRTSKLAMFTFSLLITFNLQAGISAFCFIDEFGYIAEVSATRTGPGYYELNGTADVLTGYDWAVTGYYDKAADIWSLTFTNPFPDDCGFTTDYFTYYSTSHDAGIINFDWTSYCFGAVTDVGVASTIFYKTLCPFKTAPTTPTGPARSDLSISGLKQTTILPILDAGYFRDLFFEEELSVVNTSTNNYTVSFEMATTSAVKVDIYNYAGQYITTIVESELNNGFHKFNWNGTDASGNTTNAGMYLATLTYGDNRVSCKFVK